MDFFKKRTETGAVSSWKKRRYPPLLPPENKTGVKLVSNLKEVMILDNLDVCKPLILLGLQKNIKIISTHYLLVVNGFRLAL